MKFFYYFLFVFIINSNGCISNSSKINLELLNGYWKINFITQKNETFRPNGLAKLVDHYSVEKKNGIRKKAQPLIENKFIVTEDESPFKIVNKENDYFIEFETKWYKWREKIIKLSKSELILEHQEKKYHYTRFSYDLN
ncbi:MAG: hypothetical protein CMC10_03800 [Flavobacteriaceae bacterium]|nr:hypothetical protein [Flavobacteriaceae bacterium]